MPARLTYPGVYVEEKRSGVRTISGVDTSITLFLGMARRGPVGEPRAVRSVDQFEQTYGDDPTYGELATQVRQFYLNGGASAVIVRLGGAGIAPASVTLQSEAGLPVLVLTAKDDGALGSQIRVEVDFATPTPELTFNLAVYREVVDANGNVQLTEREDFGVLSMDPGAPRYVGAILDAQSLLISSDTPGGVPLTPGADGFSQSARIHDNDAALLTQLVALLPNRDRITLAVDGGAPVTAVLPLATGTLAQWETAAAGAVQSALVAAGQPGGVTFSAQTFGAGVALRIASAAATGGSVVVTPAVQDDASLDLELGSALGGLEISGFSSLRPAPTGCVTGLHGAGTNLARLVAFAEGLRADLTDWEFDDGTPDAPYVSSASPDFGTNGTTFLEGATTTGTSLRNTRRHLDTLVASLAVGIGQSWTVSREGYRIAMRPNFGDANTGAGATLTTNDGTPGTGVVLDAAATGLSEATLFGNAAAYSVGAGGLAGFQTPGAGGNDGGVPDGDVYDDAYTRVTREVDLVNLVCLPRGDGQTDADRALLWGAASAFCQRKRAFLVVDPPSDWDTVDDAAQGIQDLRLGVVTDHAAVYWPRVQVATSVTAIDPAGTVAGIMARTDVRRGVWKAPAGLEATILGARGLDHMSSDSDNGVTNPLAINTLRRFPTGAVVWGARTMAGFDNSGEDDYRYVPVRRIALFIEESLYRGLRFAVFEPNDEPLWAQIRLAAGAFMQNLFRQGAFQGSKASDAYLVRCDATTTTQNDINLGRVNVVVAFAPLRPAEFVVLTIRQLAGQVQV